MALHLRPLTSEEATVVEKLTRSRTAPARTVERARIVWEAHQGHRVPAIATTLHLAQKTVRHWLTRFNAQGLDGLTDAPRGGRPAVYPPETVALVIQTALTPPQDLDQPFASWTIDRLTTYLHEV